EGSVVYTPWCDERGGMVADVTVTRLAADHLRVVTGAGFVAGDLSWLRWQRSHEEGVTIRDVSGDFATIGLWGRGPGTCWARSRLTPSTTAPSGSGGPRSCTSARRRSRPSPHGSAMRASSG